MFSHFDSLDKHISIYSHSLLMYLDIYTCGLFPSTSPVYFLKTTLMVSKMFVLESQLLKAFYQG